MHISVFNGSYVDYRVPDWIKFIFICVAFEIRPQIVRWHFSMNCVRWSQRKLRSNMKMTHAHHTVVQSHTGHSSQPSVADLFEFISSVLSVTVRLVITDASLKYLFQLFHTLMCSQIYSQSFTPTNNSMLRNWKQTISQFTITIIVRTYSIQTVNAPIQPWSWIKINLKIARKIYIICIFRHRTQVLISVLEHCLMSNQIDLVNIVQ